MDTEDKQFPAEIRSVLQLKKGSLVKIILKEEKSLRDCCGMYFEVSNVDYSCGTLREIIGRVVGDYYNPRCVVINPFGAHNYRSHRKARITDGIYVPLVLIKKYDKLYVKRNKQH